MCLISKNRKKKIFPSADSLRLDCDFTAWPWPLILAVAHEYRIGVPGHRMQKCWVSCWGSDAAWLGDDEVITPTACLKWAGAGDTAVLILLVMQEMLLLTVSKQETAWSFNSWPKWTLEFFSHLKWRCFSGRIWWYWYSLLLGCRAPRFQLA